MFLGRWEDIPQGATAYGGVVASYILQVADCIEEAGTKTEGAIATRGQL